MQILCAADDSEPVKASEVESTTSEQRRVGCVDEDDRSRTSDGQYFRRQRIGASADQLLAEIAVVEGGQKK